MTMTGEVFTDITGNPGLISIRSLQKTYEGTARNRIITQNGVDFMKKSSNEADLNPQPGSSIAALLRWWSNPVLKC